MFKITHVSWGECLHLRTPTFHTDIMVRDVLKKKLLDAGSGWYLSVDCQPMANLPMQQNISMYTCIYIYIWICNYIYIYKRKCVYIYILINVLVFKYTYRDICICKYTCIHIYIYAIYIYILYIYYTYIYTLSIYIYIHT